MCYCLGLGGLGHGLCCAFVWVLVCGVLSVHVVLLSNHFGGDMDVCVLCGFWYGYFLLMHLFSSFMAFCRMPLGGLVSGFILVHFWSGCLVGSVGW